MRYTHHLLVEQIQQTRQQRPPVLPAATYDWIHVVAHAERARISLTYPTKRLVFLLKDLL